MLQSSSDLRAVQELLGHAHITTTRSYTALDFQHLAKVYDQAHPRAKSDPRTDFVSLGAAFSQSAEPFRQAHAAHWAPCVSGLSPQWGPQQPGGAGSAAAVGWVAALCALAPLCASAQQSLVRPSAVRPPRSKPTGQP